LHLHACRHLDRHLDADEAVVLGAGLFAANLSSSFRLRVSGETAFNQSQAHSPGSADVV
jgi:hypothetical protein